MSNQQPTQTAFPWRATLRTALQVGLALGGVLASIWVIVADELGAWLTPDVQAWIAGAVALVVAGSAALARIMAIPAVNRWLTRLGLGAEPKGDQ